jgi:glucokinase
MILAGDIGGTKTVLALFQNIAGDLHPLRDATYASQDYASLEEIIEQFLAEETGLHLQAACFGVAGPVVEGKSTTTNLPWHLAETELTDAIGSVQVRLLNDLEASAYGMLILPPEAFALLNSAAASPPRGNIAVIAAGTGLGEAILHWDGQQFHVIATEGGHASFAPQTDLEIALLQYLWETRGGHVSYERILSGPGLVDLYTFLRLHRGQPEPDWLTQALHSEDAGPVISRHGMAGDDVVCVETLDWFASIYGAEASNLALKCMSVGGVLIGGGIAPQLLPVLQNGSFMRGFVAKGRFAKLLRTIEVKVALNPRAPLLGAAYVASQL